MEQNMPSCPKCGYDQSGEIATWEFVCPLNGRCPECGLEFEWADLLDPSRVDIDWYIEHAKGLWGLIRRTLPTLWWLLIPNRFWKRVGIETQIRLNRLVPWSVFAVVFLHVASTVGFIAADFASQYRWANRGFASIVQLVTEFDVTIARQILSDKTWWMDSLITGFGHPYFSQKWRWTESVYTDEALRMLVLCFGFTAIWIIILSVIPTTRRLAKLRVGHVLRSLFLSFLMPAVFVEIVRLIDACISFVNASSGGSGIFEVYAGPFLAHVVVYFMIVWVQWHWVSAIRFGWKIHPSRLLIGVGLFGSISCSYLFASLLAALWIIFRASLY